MLIFWSIWLTLPSKITFKSKYLNLKLGSIRCKHNIRWQHLSQIKDKSLLLDNFWGEGKSKCNRLHPGPVLSSLSWWNPNKSCKGLARPARTRPSYFRWGHCWGSCWTRPWAPFGSTPSRELSPRRRIRSLTCRRSGTSRTAPQPRLKKLVVTRYCCCISYLHFLLFN